MHDFKNTHVFYIESQNNTVQTFFFFYFPLFNSALFFLGSLSCYFVSECGRQNNCLYISWIDFLRGSNTVVRLVLRHPWQALVLQALCFLGREKKKKQSRVRTPFLFSFSTACYRGQALKKQPKKSLQAKFIHSSKTQLKNALLIKNDTKWS